MIKYIIVDDEPLAHQIIETYCDNLPHLKLEANCYNGFEAIEFLNKKNVDIIFLDINMPKLKGFDFLKTLSNPPKIIVTTAYKEYAVEGYELDIVDYLLKPFSFNRFVKAINKATIEQHSVSKSNSETEKELQSIFIKGDKKHHRVSLKEILFIEAYGNYTKFHLADNVLLSHEKISELEVLLPQEKFMRVHKSYIISVEKVSIIEGNRISIGEEKIPIGQTYKKKIGKLLS